MRVGDDDTIALDEGTTTTDEEANALEEGVAEEEGIADEDRARHGARLGKGRGI